MAQLAILQGTAGGVVTVPRGVLIANLAVGSRGTSVKQLQIFLNANGFTITSLGLGSPGQETEFFGRLTENAVQRFQTQYGIVSSGTPSTTGYGHVGPRTRAKINELLGN